MSRQLAFSSTISVMVMAAFALSTAATAYARDAAPRAARHGGGDERSLIASRGR